MAGREGHGEARRRQGAWAAWPGTRLTRGHGVGAGWRAASRRPSPQKWSVQGVPGARILQHLAAAPVSVLVQHHCLVARAGGRVVAHGETPIPVDLRPIQCSGAGPAHADLGQPFTARFDVSKAGVVPASLERLLVEASAGQEAGRVLDIRRGGRTSASMRACPLAQERSATAPRVGPPQGRGPAGGGDGRGARGWGRGGQASARVSGEGGA